LKFQHPIQPKSDTRLTVFGVCIFLVAITWIVFGQTVRFDFVNYDDDRYVYKNPEVARGLTSHGLRWAFTHAHGDNWHPLSTLSHMLDCQLFGLNAGRHHFMNLVLHTIAAILLFLVLRSMTGGPRCEPHLRWTGGIWQSAFVATVFAIHPLRAESVAWISERKDVLSAVFFMLTLGAYLRYTKGPSVRHYLTMSIFFALGLMSKPMLVTTPFILLLLDYWPLSRLTDVRELRHRIVEKLPLFALSAASCAATVLTQRHATASMEELPLVLRIENALVSYVVYIRQTLWPTRLAAFYPHAEDALPLWQIALAAALLLLITANIIAFRKQRPYLVTGWFWYLVMLIPVIGLMQVGSQAHADRYTYLPQIGLLLMVSWTVVDFFVSQFRSPKLLMPVAGLVIAALACAAWRQASYWRNGELLWERALAATSKNFIAYDSLGDFLLNHGQLDDAIHEFERSIDARPSYANAHDNLGVALTAKGELDSAIIHLQEAIQLRPNQAKAYFDLANAHFQHGEMKEAIRQNQLALSHEPHYADAHFNLATAFAQDGNSDSALVEYQKAIDDNPDYAEAHYALGNTLLEKGRIDEALSHYQQAARIKPNYAEVENNIALALLHKGQPADAIAHWRKSVEIKPDFIEALNNLAWMLATFPDDKLRSGTESLALAKQAMQLSSGQDPSIFRTLAAACAETGRYADAIDIAQRGLHLAIENENSALADILERDLASYRANTPIRTAPQPTDGPL
jgi:tetratricopeptide (TPR) repeat protein